MLLRIARPVVALMALSVTSTLGAQVTTKSAIDCAKVSDTTTHVNMDHAAHRKVMDACAGVLPTMPGQAAFAAIAEVIGILNTDPATDWTRVNVEALRQHLIDMDEVIMRARVTQRDIPGGLEMTVTGTGRTADAIKRMAVNHTQALTDAKEYQASAETIATGARLTVTAMNPADARAVSRIRGLGFAGLMTEGDHHAAHHIALARGDAHVHKD